MHIGSLSTELKSTIMIMNSNSLKLREKSPWGSKRGLVISIALHLILVLISTLWAISTINPEGNITSHTFATRANGGGDDGRKMTIAHKPKAKSKLPKSLTKITCKTIHAKLALPELPELSQPMIGGTSPSSKGFGRGGAGEGGGSGGGRGSGKVIGAVKGGEFGVSKGMPTGRKVLGLNISGEKIAVYLDSSGSMTDSLKAVKEQIEKEFPKADVFTGDGIYTFIRDGVFAGGNLPGTRIRFSDKPARETPEKDYKLLNFTQLRDILRKRNNAGNVGGWIDIMLKHSNYDALVIFSDFQDPSAQDNGNSCIFYSTPGGRAIDNRTYDEKAWEERWLHKFALANSGQAPRLYLMSTNNAPERCPPVVPAL
jgi:hypothetical protein